MSVTGLSVRRRASFVLAVTLGLVALADWLFYGQPAGINTALFGGALVSAVALRDGRFMRGWPGRIATLGCLGLIVALALEPGPLPIALGLVGLFTLVMIDRNGWTASVGWWLIGWGRFAWRAATQPLRDARLRQRWHRSRGMKHPLLVGLIRWFVPVALSLIFVALFALANPIIEGWLVDVPELLAPLRIMLWVVIGFGVWGLLRARLPARRLTRRGRAWPPAAIDRMERDTGTSWVTRSLLLFNAVFAVQTALDLLYLYGGAVLPEGMTYAEYARRGAYPLVFTALLAGAFVLLTFRPGGLATRSALARRLVYLWVAQNVLLVLSSAWRLSLYVDVYSLTRWRVAAAVWMGMVAIGLLLLMWRIWRGRDNRWLLQANAMQALVILYVCCFVNFERLIADYNVAHCREAVQMRAGNETVDEQRARLDLAYVESLGPDAIPALTRLIERAGAADEHALAREATLTRDALRLTLRKRTANWRGWTIRRALLSREMLAYEN